MYQTKNKEAKRQVAIARSNQCQAWLAKSKGEQMKSLYKMAKQAKLTKTEIVGASCVKDTTGKLILEQDGIKNHWKSYYFSLLNETNPINVDFNADVVEGPIHVIKAEELREALKTMKRGKAAGPTGLTSEIILEAGDVGFQHLLSICQEFWNTAVMPKDWCSSTTVPLYKGKGDPLNCASYRGIRLLEHGLKIIEKVIHRRLLGLLKIGNYQYGFMAGKSTIDAIFIMRQLQEKFCAKKLKLYHIFVDLEKAFDRVSRKAIVWSLRRQFVPERLIELIMAMYHHTATAVCTPCGVTSEFNINAGVHQGSILSPLLFITVMEEVTKSIRSNDYCELMYADDIVLTEPSEEQVARRFVTWKNQLTDHGLKINIDKTKVLVTGEPNEPVSRGRWPCSVCKSGVGNNSILCNQCKNWCHKKCSRVIGSLISVSNFVCPTCMKPNQSVLQNHCWTNLGIEPVNEFLYLGDVLDSKAGAEAAVRGRIKAAWSKWRLMASILTRRDIPIKLRTSLYGTVIRPVLLYGSETWPMTQKLEQQIARTDHKMLRWIHRIQLEDRVSSLEILNRSGLCEIDKALRQHRLRWFGHVERSQDKIIMTVKNMEIMGKRPRGRPKRTWSQTIQMDLEYVGLAKEDALDRKLWKSRLVVQPPYGDNGR